MKRRFEKAYNLFLVLCLFVLLLAGCYEKASNTENKFVFGTNAEFPPFEFKTTKGIIEGYDGIDIAIAKEIAGEIGQEPTISNMEFDSLLIALQNGQVDAVISGLTLTKERAEAVDFSKPYYVATQVMVTKSGSNIAKASDMKDKKIAVVHGFTGQTVVSSLGFGKNSTTFKTGMECIMELVNNKCDVVVIDKATAKSYIDHNKSLNIIEDEESFGSESYAIAVKKGNGQLLAKINAAIDKLSDNNFISEISTKYL